MRSDGVQRHVWHHDSSLRDYLRIARRRKWIILQAVVVVPMVAVLFSLHQKNLYSANAQVLISRQNLANTLTGTVDPSIYVPSDRLAQTQADLARVPEVAKRTIAAAGLHRSPADLLGNSSVTAKVNADLLDFSVTDHTPALAVRLASEYAKQFVRYRQQLDTTSLHRARAEVQHEIAKLRAGGDKNSALYANLVGKEQQLATMEALQTSNASVVKLADKATKVQPKPVRNGILGFALGLVLGIGLAFLRETLDTRVRSTEEIAELLGMPLLARLAEPPRHLRKENELAMLAEPRGTGAEAFRMLRTNLAFVRLGHDARTIMVTSSVEQEGKSTTAANLAVALARAGQRVALVDLDLRRPFLDQFFDLGRRPGLTQVAIGQASLDDALAPVAIGNDGDILGLHKITGIGSGRVTVRASSVASLPGSSLSVLATGPIPPNAGEFAGTAALAEILATLRDRYDTVLIDAPPSLHVGDAMALSGSVDALLVVTRMNVVHRPMLNELKRLFDASPALKLGFIVTGAEDEEGYGYGGGYSYGSYAAQQQGATAST